MEFVKILLMTILIIGIVSSVVFGVIDIVKLAVDLGETGTQVVENVVDNDGEAQNMAQTINTAQDRTMLERWHENMRDIVISGIGLAVTWMGWKSVKEYYEEDHVKVYKGR